MSGDATYDGLTKRLRQQTYSGELSSDPVVNALAKMLSDLCAEAADEIDRLRAGWIEADKIALDGRKKDAEHIMDLEREVLELTAKFDQAQRSETAAPLTDEQIKNLAESYFGSPALIETCERAICAAFSMAGRAQPSATATMLFVNGDCRAEVKTKQEAAFAKLMTFFNDHKCWSGESFMQRGDDTHPDALDLLCDILDLIEPKVTYDE